ncbi:hypothetical protein HK100_012114 [Physocladia obscura]|uniref:Carboxylic ester hydrolase n=1 Tax=Physocladia obscura TaxID=109957 RepID=A0AAD5T083_9FUNG|nr:hypothetical protein HK100_012114 [Physocladia obscura]
MAALYPDLYAGASAFMGVPFNCWQSSASPSATAAAPWDSTCATGQRILPAATWASYVTNAFPGYSGSRPKMQLWHGTADTTLYYVNLGEEIKQWTTVLGAPNAGPATTVQSGWTRTQYTNSAGQVLVEAYSIAGAGHVLPLSGMVSPYLINFFPGLKGATTGVPTTTTTTANKPPSTTTTTAAKPTTTTSGGQSSCSALYGQCGGLQTQKRGEINRVVQKGRTRDSLEHIQ